MTIQRYDFEERLGWSQGNAPTLNHVARILVDRIPGCTHITQASKNEDKHGTDWWAHRKGLRPLSIDLKNREKDYGRDDLALETWNVIDKSEPNPHSPFVFGKRVGWTRDPDKTTDFVLWHWPTKRFCLMPFPPLCNVFGRLWRDWAVNFKCAAQDSGDWFSQCVFVPRYEVAQAILRWMGIPAASTPSIEHGPKCSCAACFEERIR